MSFTQDGVFQVEICDSNNTRGWFLVIYGYKSFLLVMGLYMAWETRHVKIQALNDSQYIVICAYSTVSSAAVVFISNTISQDAAIGFLATAFSILISTTITLFLMFLPKLRIVLGASDEDEFICGVGLKIESNTKRLLVDDRKEVADRIEIQNKLYRCELRALDREIARLESMLGQPDDLETFGGDVPFTVGGQNRGSCLLAVPPARTAGGGSWPSMLGRSSLGKVAGFCSEKKLDHVPENPGLFRHLRGFCGNIPSGWLSSPQVNVHPEHDALREKPKSNPEFYTKCVVPSYDFPRRTILNAEDQRDDFNI